MGSAHSIRMEAEPGSGHEADKRTLNLDKVEKKCICKSERQE